jgi:uncharacterized protein YunC (DUF1805 family)
MFKNVASQKVTLLVIDTATNLPKTGDAANLTFYVQKDDGSVTALGDTSAAEVDSTNALGLYVCDLTQAETNGDKLLFTGKSSTSGVRVVPLLLQTVPAGFTSSVAQTGDSYAIVNHGTNGNAAIKTSVDTIDDFLDTEIAAIKAKTDGLPSDPADASDIAALFVTVNTKLDTFDDLLDTEVASLQSSLNTIDDFLDTEIAAIKAKTDNLPSDPADASDIAAAFTSLNTKVDTIDDFLDTEIAAIKAKTDNLPSDPADASDIAASFASLTTAVNTIDDFLDTEMATLTTMATRFGGMIELDGAVYRYTTNSLEQAPAGGGGGGDTFTPVPVPVGEHYVETGDSLEDFAPVTTVNPATQAPTTYDDTEFTLYIDGVADDMVITWTEVAEGSLQMAGTLPTITAGQRLRIVASSVEADASGDVWFGVVPAPNQSIVTYVTQNEAESEGLNLLCKVGSLGVPKSVTTESDLTDWGAKVLVIERANNPRTDIQVIENADITISTVTAANDTFTFQPSSTVLDKPSDYVWSLREVSSGYVIAEGRLAVSYAALEDVP